MKSRWTVITCAVVGCVQLVGSSPADDDDTQPTPEAVERKDGFDPPEGLRPLTKDDDIWIDSKRKLVVVDGEVCLSEGQLEMFACPRGTKEHESVIAVNAKASYVHAGLLLVGAKRGRPVSFDPEYRPASGTIVDVWVLWRDEEGKKKRVRAQEWIRNVETRKPLEYDWVFAGSSFWEDPETKERFYNANAGDFICVSNFPSATLDLPVESPQANASLLFEAYPGRVPAKGTKVRLVLAPRLEAKKDSETKANSGQGKAEAGDNDDPKSEAKK